MSGHTQPKRRSKFKNIRTTIDGITFASKKEAARWLFLKDLEEKGVILNLERQRRYALHVQGIKIGSYISDFEYTIRKSGIHITEDIKSRATVTALYRRNKKHMLIEHHINVIEVYRPDEPVPLQF